MLFRKKERSKDAEIKTAEQIEAEKAAKKEKAIAEYKEKRTITVARFFQIAGMEMPSRLAPIADRVVTLFTADTRRTGPDNVFFCWDNPLYEKFKNDPLEPAIRNESLLILTDRPCDYPWSVYIPDPDHTAIRDIYIKTLHYIRSIHKAKVIAVTGSIGKTSTKEMIESVVRQHYKKPLISKGNNNSMFSVGRNIQSLKRPTNVYLQEVGAHSPGVVEASARELECDMAVYTNISYPHLELYGSLENILEDKASLSRYGKKEGLAFVNYDDPLLMRYPFSQEKITYSLKNPGAQYYARDISSSPDGFTFTIVDQKTEGSVREIPAAIHVPGQHNVLNAIAAYAVGKALRLKDEEILNGISAYHPTGMRQNFIEINGYHIFADCYNANKISIESALSTMDQIALPAGGRRIAVLGDILSLGELHEQIHREVGQSIKNHHIDKLLCYGIDARYIWEEALKDGVDAKYFPDRSELEKEIRNLIKPEDVILFKSSHDVNLGASIDRLFGTDINESTAIGHKQFRLVVKGDFEYYIFETSASIKTYLGSDERVTIPSAIEAEVTSGLTEETSVKVLSVEKIGKTAFRNKTHVKEVILPDTVVRIRSGAFKGSGLTHFEVPETLLSIGDEAFAECPDLKSVSFPDRNLEIGEKILAESPNAVVKCKKDSAAEKYAMENDYKTERI